MIICLSTNKSHSRMKPNEYKLLGFVVGIIIGAVISIAVIVIIILNIAYIPDEVHINYVDLGLPSGTLWGDKNADHNDIDNIYHYSYDSAIERFGNKLPTKEQLNELRRLCHWEWMRNGYKITGPNGNFIFLPASGMCDSDGLSVDNNKYAGFYWLSASNSSDNVNMLYFHENNVCEYEYYRNFQLSVRLVQIEESQILIEE